jgi:hypothetical protein
VIIVIPYTAEQAEAAESLCDWVYALSGKKQSGSCLLISTDDTHPEFQLKVRLAAEVAFEFVDSATANKDNLFKTAVSRIADNYKEPWLWLEPDCVPLKPDWREQLSAFYDSQPRKCAGAHLTVKESGKLWLGRQSIYPATNFPPDPFIASTKCRLIQQGVYTKREDVRPDAVLFCSDKTGELITTLRDELK